MWSSSGSSDSTKKEDDQIQIESSPVSISDEQLNDRRPKRRRRTKDTNTQHDQIEMAKVTTMEDLNCTLADSMSRNRRIVDDNAEELSRPTTPVVSDIKAEHVPIVGYAKEPLLPLYKACAPLVHILHDLYAYVQVALNETPEVPADELTIDESAAIRLYTMEWQSPHPSLYSMLNQTLRDGNREHLRPYFKYMKLFVTALVKLPCVPQSTIWRGITKNLSADFTPNTSVTSRTFSSCTAILSLLEDNTYLGSTGERTLLSIETINGRKIRAHSHFLTEDEILLLPGTHMVVQSQISPAPNLHIIHLKQIIPDEVLLEPPFEGKSNITNNRVLIFIY